MIKPNLQDEFDARRRAYMDLPYEERSAEKHQELYAWLAGQLNVSDSDLPRKMKDFAKSRSKHFDDIPLREWDCMAEILRLRVSRFGIRVWSLSDGVCTLKAYARKRVQELA